MKLHKLLLLTNLLNFKGIYEPIKTFVDQIGTICWWIIKKIEFSENKNETKNWNKYFVKLEKLV